MGALPFLIDFVFIGLFVFTVMTQIVIPLATDRPLFPIFNKRRQRLTDRLAKIHEQQDLNELIQEVKKEEKRSKK